MADSVLDSVSSSPSSASTGDSGGANYQSSNSTPAATPATPAAPAPDAQAAKSAASGGGETQDANGAAAPGTDPAKPSEDAGNVQDTGSELEIDPDLLSFATAKGIDVEHLSNAQVRNLAKSYHAAEGNMNRLQNENRQFREQIANFDAMQLQQSQPVDEISPLQKVKSDFAAAIENQCNLHGCSSPAELQQKFPGVWQNLQTLKQSAWEEAVESEPEWKQQRQSAEEAKKSSQQRLLDQMRQAKMTYRENVLSAKQQNPTIETDLIKSGVVGMVSEFAKAFNAPIEFLMAHKPIWDAATKLAASWKTAANIDKTIATKRQEWEKGLQKSKSAEMLGDEPLPDDQRKLFPIRAQATGRGVTIE
jgi:hypothetical protein